MQIFMVIKATKPFDETLTQNVKPFVSEAAAHIFADDLCRKLTAIEHADYTEYYVETHDLVDA